MHATHITSKRRDALRHGGRPEGCGPSVRKSKTFHSFGHLTKVAVEIVNIKSQLKNRYIHTYIHIERYRETRTKFWLAHGQGYRAGYFASKISI